MVTFSLGSQRGEIRVEDAEVWVGTSEKTSLVLQEGRFEYDFRAVGCKFLGGRSDHDETKVDLIGEDQVVVTPGRSVGSKVDFTLLNAQHEKVVLAVTFMTPRG